jgi:hypothetical protein
MSLALGIALGGAILSLIGTGVKRAGAEYWAGQRSLPNPGNCDGTPDFVKGCREAQARLAGTDLLRKSQPAYRQGWNSYVASATPEPVQPSPTPAPPTSASPTASALPEQDEREHAAENLRRQLEKRAAEGELNGKLKELGFQLLSPIDLDLDWKSFMTNQTKVAVRGTYIEAHDVEVLSTPDNKDQPEIRLYTDNASRDARKIMLECRNNGFQFSSCDMIVGATIQSCIRNKGELNEKEIPCLNVQEAYLVP